jgi:Domain of unknown function (DUF3576)
MTTSVIPTGLVLALCLPLLAGCGQSRPNDPSGNSADYYQGGASQMLAVGSMTGGDNTISLGVRKDRPGTAGGGAGGGAAGGGGLAINAYLWRGALDTLSFMPLASADPFGGVIVTDWYAPPASSSERFKATAYIMGSELRSDAVRVAIYRQVLQDGQWVDATVSPMTVGEIEDKVLARARELRTQSQASN